MPATSAASRCCTSASANREPARCAARARCRRSASTCRISVSDPRRRRDRHDEIAFGRDRHHAGRDCEPLQRGPRCRARSGRRWSSCRGPWPARWRWVVSLRSAAACRTLAFRWPDGAAGGAAQRPRGSGQRDARSPATSARVTSSATNPPPVTPDGVYRHEQRVEGAAAPDGVNRTPGFGAIGFQACCCSPSIPDTYRDRGCGHPVASARHRGGAAFRRKNPGRSNCWRSNGSPTRSPTPNSSCRWSLPRLTVGDTGSANWKRSSWDWGRAAGLPRYGWSC